MQYSSYADMSDAELRKEIYKLSRDLYKEARLIKEAHRADPLIPDIKAKEVVKLKTDMRKNPTKYMERKDLIKRARQIRYLNDLKTTRFSTAVGTGRQYEPIRQYVSKLSPEEKQEFFKVYQKLYERTSSYEKFKYELFEDMLDYRKAVKGNEEMYQQLADIIIQARDTIDRDFYDLEQSERDALFRESMQDLFGKN